MPRYLKLETMTGNDPVVRLRKIKDCSTSEVFIMKECNPLTEYQSKFPTYYRLFQDEYTHMKHLEKHLNQSFANNIYSKFFPIYKDCGLLTCGSPYIMMEYIEGDTLEQKLSQHPMRQTPAFLFTPKQIRHLIDQIHEAQCLLKQVGILQLDLNPKNIIIQNNNYDIKLIDFTDVYYISDTIRHQRQHPYKLIDNRINRNLPIEQQLQISIANLFTRLFYSGNDCYAKSNIQVNRHSSFFSQYRILLDCLEQRELLLNTVPPQDKLYYWNLWYLEFCQLFHD